MYLSIIVNWTIILVSLPYRGQMPLHILGQYGRDSAAPIFELFRQSMPDYPIDKPDAEGNSGMLK